VLTSQINPINVKEAVTSATLMQTHHQFGALDSTILQILLVTQLKSRLLVTNTCSSKVAGATLSSRACWPASIELLVVSEDIIFYKLMS
jgi:hypothetical protein